MRPPSLAWPCRSADEIIDRVLAIVAGNLITLSDVNAAKDHSGPVAAELAGASAGEILPRLIDRALMLGEVDRYAPPEPAAADVDSSGRRRAGAIRGGAGVSDGARASRVRRTSPARNASGRICGSLAYLDQRFTVPPPTEDDLGRYYRRIPRSSPTNGQLAPFDAARPRIAEAVTADRRSQLVNDWVAGLRRRAEIVEVSKASVRPVYPPTAMNCTSCTRLNPEWLTIGAIADRRRV